MWGLVMKFLSRFPPTSMRLNWLIASLLYSAGYQFKSPPLALLPVSYRSPVHRRTFVTVLARAQSNSFVICIQIRLFVPLHLPQHFSSFRNDNSPIGLRGTLFYIFYWWQVGLPTAHPPIWYQIKLIAYISQVQSILQRCANLSVCGSGLFC